MELLIIKRAASYIKSCDALIVMSGAGMSIDSGIPGFTGFKGLIKAIGADVDYRNILNPAYFKDYPSKFWYIYGHRYNLYSDAIPHKGYHHLLEVCANKSDFFIQTSNVDNMWIKTGVDPIHIYEMHGNIYHLQCYQCQTITFKKGLTFNLNHSTKESLTIPQCDHCGSNLRPNILLWNDMTFITDRCHQ